MPTYKSRDGQMVEADEVFLAWTTQDVDRMTRAVDIPTHPVDRHFLLLALAQVWYSLRGEPGARARFIEIATMHRREFAELMPHLVRELRGIVPRVPFFADLATVYTEDGRFEDAIAVCEEALAYGLRDGTKTGFQGRIDRIRKKALKHRRGDA